MFCCCSLADDIRRLLSAMVRFVDFEDDVEDDVFEDVVDRLLLVLVFLMHVGHICGSSWCRSVSGDMEMSARIPLSGKKFLI